jgi:hypothetical protein
MAATTRCLRPGHLAFTRSWLFAVFLAAAGAASAQVTTINTPNRTEGGYFGASVAGLADIDGDGFGDLVVGAPGEGPAGQATAGGRVYVFSGRTGALIRMHWSPNQRPDGRFGSSVAGVPDTDGDGVMDILVGAPGEGYSAQVGRAYLYSGANGALLRVFASPQQLAGGMFGKSVAGVADMDGDGFGDVVIGAPDETNGGAPTGSGRAHVFSGRTGAFLRTLLSQQPVAGGSFGESVAGVSDVDGDGRGDIVVGAPRESPSGTSGAGNAYLFSGGTGTLLRRFQSPGREVDGSFGESVAGVPDVDGDGRGDVVIGAPAENPGSSPVDCGRAYIYSGATGALLWKLLPSIPQANGNFGCRVAGIPDVTGDSRGDVIVGAWREAPGGAAAECGRAHIYSGGTGVRFKSLPSPSQSADGLFGFAVAGIPDTNGSGNTDVVIGAVGESPNADTAAYAGRVFIVRN